jgi:hypothetical protein
MGERMLHGQNNIFYSGARSEFFFLPPKNELPGLSLANSRHPQSSPLKKQSKLCHLDVRLIYIEVITHLLCLPLPNIICHGVEAIYGQPGEEEEVPQLHPSDAETLRPGRHETGDVL